MAERTESSNVLVTVVIPTRNRARILERTLPAVCDQRSAGALEIIVADDGSTDETPDLVRRFASRAPDGVAIIYVRSRSRGANAARNAAIEVAKGEIVVFCDDDVLVPPGWLENLTAPVREGRADVAAGPVVLDPSLRLPGCHADELAALVTHVPEVTVPMLCNMAVRKEVLDRHRFDPNVEAPVEEIEWLERSGAT